MKMDRRQAIADSFAQCIARLDVVLRPWGFEFRSSGVEQSHIGPYASGYYCRELTRISLSCRATIDNVYYEHSFVTKNYAYTSAERFVVGHEFLMRALGHLDDCHIIENHRQPDWIVARDGGDRVAALIHDLTAIAGPILSSPCAEFDAVMRKGRRSYKIL